MPDYFHPGVFFAMAKLCSAPRDTVHYLYTMNWIQTCYGSNILDLDVNARKKYFDWANDTIDLNYAMLDLKTYLVFPPFTNPINSSSIPLQTVSKKKWCEKFFSQGPLRKSSQWDVLPEVYDPISRTNTTFWLFFSFDEDINFKPY